MPRRSSASAPSSSSAAGAPLREAADALGLAWWLRKLPPQAFSAPLPAFPTDPEFAFRIASLIPRDPQLAADLAGARRPRLRGRRAAYALWLARQPDLTHPPEELFMFMAAWAWFSEQHGLSGHRLLRQPWTANMSFKRAREELGVWRQRLRLIECLGHGIESPWLADGTALGYSFVALRTVEDFIAESEALDNCLDQYADQLHTGLTAVFSIRKGARSVACVEIGLHDEEVTMPTIVQLRAARNRRARPRCGRRPSPGSAASGLEPLRAGAAYAPRPVEARRSAAAAVERPTWRSLPARAHEQPFRRLVIAHAVSRRTRAVQRGRGGDGRIAAEVARLGERMAVPALERGCHRRGGPDSSLRPSHRMTSPTISSSRAMSSGRDRRCSPSGTADTRVQSPDRCATRSSVCSHGTSGSCRPCRMCTGPAGIERLRRRSGAGGHPR